MSGDSFGIFEAAAVAAIVIPTVAAGAVVAGTIYGVRLTIRAGERLHQRWQEEELQRQRMLAREDLENQARIRKLREQYSQVSQDFQSHRDEIGRQMRQELQSLEADLTDGLNAAEKGITTDLQEKANRLHQQIESRWRMELRDISRTYESHLQQSFESVRADLKSGAVEFDAMQNDMARDARTHELAVDMLAQAQAALRNLQIESGKVFEQFVEAYNRAADHFSNGNDTLAYSSAVEVVLNCLDKLQDTLQERARRELLTEQLEARLAGIQGCVDSLGSLHFTYKGKQYEDDLRRFMPEYFDAFSRNLTALSDALKNAHHEVELQGLNTDLEALEQDLSELTKMASQKLLAAYLENDSAQTVSAILAEQGFQPEEYAYRGDVEGGDMHINYYNAISNERLTVVLSPDHNDIRVEVHQFGDGSQQMDPNRQKAIDNVLSQGLGLQMTCRNPGQASVRHDTSDLTQVRRHI